VSISGSGFSQVTSVKFNGNAIPFTVVNTALIRVSVPTGATTGPIVVTTEDGSATSATSFTVLPSIITGFSPSSGPIETNVRITGAGFSGVTSVNFGDVRAEFKVESSMSILTDVPKGAVTGPISVTTANSVAKSMSNFTVLPGISRFFPVSGIAGTGVSIVGQGFSGTTQVKFGVVNAIDFTINSDNLITATVPAGTATGRISIVTPDLTLVSLTSFAIVPQIDSLSPSRALPGSSVTINGGGFIGATSVKFGNVTAGFTLLSPTSIKATVPAGAVSSPVSVTTAGGTATSRTEFIVLPKIDSISPISGHAGIPVLISGSGFSRLISVQFNGNEVSFKVVSPILISLVVPQGARSGPIVVTTESGIATSPTSFTVIQ
jgi:hypothetical protein